MTAPTGGFDVASLKKNALIATIVLSLIHI